MSDLDAITIVLLRWPEPPASFTEEELEVLQEQHLSFLDSLRDRGVLLAAGPFDGQPEERLRGISVFSVGVEEAQSLAEEDPMVKAGRLEVHAFTWFTRPGEVVFPRPTSTPT